MFLYFKFIFTLSSDRIKTHIKVIQSLHVSFKSLPKCFKWQFLKRQMCDTSAAIEIKVKLSCLSVFVFASEQLHKCLKVTQLLKRYRERTSGFHEAKCVINMKLSLKMSHNAVTL